MSIVENQQRTFLELAARLRPHWRRDPALPVRIEALLRRDRRFGSRDRRLYRELLYTAVRHLPWIEPSLDREPARAAAAVALLSAETAATHQFRSSLVARALSGAEGPAAPESIQAKAAALAPLLGEAAVAHSLLPAWFESECPEAFTSPTYDLLNTRAPLWLRLQIDDPAAVFGEFSGLGWTWRTRADHPSAVELTGEVDVTRTEAYRLGRIEVQDAGSQRILESVGIAPGGRWLDACAGAGGKSLQLAGLLGPAGHVDATDVRPAALAELGRRALRAGLESAISRPARPGADYDGVLVDAPCSGSGTWRRAPHLKWTTTADRVQAAARQQHALLAHFSSLVRRGGRLVYATCSLCRSENEKVVAEFLSAFPAFAPAPFARPGGGEPRGAGLIFWPATHDGDGYFCASLLRMA